MYQSNQKCHPSLVVLLHALSQHALGRRQFTAVHYVISSFCCACSLPALVKAKGKSAYVHLASSLLNNLAAQPNDAQV